MPTIVPRDHDDAARLAAALVKAAGTDQAQVATVTAGPRVAFDVPDKLADAVSGDGSKKGGKK
jgi:hypothetical protein